MGLFCKYKDIAGVPNEGVHAARFMGMASVDLGLTALFSVFVSYKYNISLLFVFMIIMTIGIIAHWAFCVDTALIKWLGLAASNSSNVGCRTCKSND